MRRPRRLINSGLGRARSAAHTMTAALCVIAVAACAYVICGRSWQGSGAAGRVLFIHGVPWNWIAAAPPFFAKLPFDGSPALLTAWMGTHRRRAGWPDSIGQRRRTLAFGFDLYFDRNTRRVDVSAGRALGVGRRLAGATR